MSRAPPPLHSTGPVFGAELSAALRTGFAVSKHGFVFLFSLSLAAATALPACPGSSGGALVATQAGRKTEFMERIGAAHGRACVHAELCYSPEALRGFEAEKKKIKKAEIRRFQSSHGFLAVPQISGG